MAVSDGPGCGITYDHLCDNSRYVIYDHNIFITQATEVTKGSLYEHWVSLVREKLLKSIKIY